MKSNNEIVIYQTDELPRVEVQIDNETVWLSQEQMASLFGRNRVAITQHIGLISIQKLIGIYFSDITIEISTRF